jgi:hypothetical protein
MAFTIALCQVRETDTSAVNRRLASVRDMARSVVRKCSVFVVVALQRARRQFWLQLSQFRLDGGHKVFIVFIPLRNSSGGTPPARRVYLGRRRHGRIVLRPCGLRVFDFGARIAPESCPGALSTT